MKSVSAKIMAYITSVIFIALIVLGITSIYMVNNEIEENYSTVLNSNMNYIQLSMNNITDEVTKNTKAYHALLMSELKSKYGGKFESNGTKLYDDGHLLNDNYEFLDTFAELTNNFVMLFAYDGEDFTRVANTLKGKNGNRLVGDKLNRNFTSYKNMTQKNIGFIGKAVFDGEQYLIDYEPLMNNGKLVGAIATGYNFSKTMDNLMNALKEKSIRKNGYFLAWTNGGFGDEQRFLFTQPKSISHSPSQMPFFSEVKPVERQEIIKKYYAILT